MSNERSRSSTWPSYPAVKCRTVMIGTWWLNSRRTISDPETIKDHSEDAVHDGNQHQAADDGACGGFADGAGAALGLSPRKHPMAATTMPNTNDLLSPPIRSPTVTALLAWII